MYADISAWYDSNNAILTTFLWTILIIIKILTLSWKYFVHDEYILLKNNYIIINTYKFIGASIKRVV